MMRAFRRLLVLPLLALAGCAGIDDIDMTDPFRGSDPAPVSRGARPGAGEVGATRPSDADAAGPGSPTGWVDEDAPPPPAGTLPEPPPVPPYEGATPAPPAPLPGAAGPAARAPAPGTIDTSAHPAGGTSDKDPYFKTLLGSPPDELPAGGAWLTPPVGVDIHSPPSLAALRGQVVYLHFAFSGCPSCGHMKQYLEQWQKVHGPNGFTVVFVCNGMMDTLEKAKEFAAGHSFPLYFDKGADATKQYGVRVFPMGYLIDRSGNVVWEGSPMGLEDKVGALVASTVK